MEAFLTGRVSKLGLDEEAFVPYLASLASDRESADEPLRDRLQTALENIGAENFDAFLNELVTFCESLTISEQHSREQQEAEARVQAETERILQTSRHTHAYPKSCDVWPEIFRRNQVFY